MAGGQEVGSLYAKIGADYSGLTQGLRSVDTGLRRSKSEMERMGIAAQRLSSQMRTAGFVLTGVSVGVLAIGAGFVKAAMDAVESENLFTVSMKGMAGAATAWSKEVSDALKLNEVEVRRQVGVLNTMFNAMHLGEQASFDMAKGLTMLGADLSSFFNIAQDDAMEKLRAAIVGETEPMRRLGVVINETTVKAYAMRQGWIKGGQELSEQGKVLARYNLLLEGTRDAQGDLARTMDSPANALRGIQNQFASLSREIGEIFLPTIGQALGWVSNEGMPKAKAALDALKASWGEMGDEAKRNILIVAGLLVATGPLLLGLSFAFTAITALGKAFVALRVKALLELTAIGWAFWSFFDQLNKLAMKTPGWGKPFPGLENWPRTFGDAVGSVTDKVSELVSGEDGVETLEAALKDLGITGLPSIETLRSEFDKLTASVGGAGLASELRQVEEAMRAASAIGDVAALDQLTEQWGRIKAEMAAAGRVSADAYGKMTPPPGISLAAAETEDVASATKDAAREQEALAREMERVEAARVSALGGIQAYVDELVRMHPASIAAAQGVAALQAEIIVLEAAQRANAEAQRAHSEAMRQAQDQLRGMQAHASNLSRALSEANQRLTELGQPRLTGMQALDDQLFALEQKTKRLSLQKLLLPTGADATQIDAQVEAIRKQMDTLRLRGELTWDAPLRRLKTAAEGAKKELTFEEALKQIGETKGQIAGLTGELGAAEAAVRAQEGAIRGMEEASRALADASRQIADQLQNVQAQLRLQEERQRLVNETLETAYKWFTEDRLKLMELGGEAVTQAEIIDEETRRLIELTSAYAKEEAAAAIKAINEAVAAYNLAKAHLAAGLPIGVSEAIPAMAAGGIITRPTLALLGESGAEAIIPLGHGGGAAGAAAINITVNVHGNAIYERDLAETIRRELLRSSARNAGLGLS